MIDILQKKTSFLLALKWLFKNLVFAKDVRLEKISIVKADVKNYYHREAYFVDSLI
ncbi:hypothetical protein [Pseudopedobacter sp.]|uniref:hypothetical protein n=1 Tax=Pseudopedobacter sp. TaxID=1936787 RepID=UPI0033427D6A